MSDADTIVTVLPKLKKPVVRKKKPLVVKKAKAPSITEQLDKIGIDAICQLVEYEDKSHAQIAAGFNISTTSLVNWLEADIVRSARVKEARIRSALKCDQLALDALRAIPDSGSPATIARQREIASHYRWRAKVRNPREFGDAIKVDADVKVTPKMDEVEAKIAALQALMAK